MATVSRAAGQQPYIPCVDFGPAGPARGVRPRFVFVQFRHDSHGLPGRHLMPLTMGWEANRFERFCHFVSQSVRRMSWDSGALTVKQGLFNMKALLSETAGGPETLVIR